MSSSSKDSGNPYNMDSTTFDSEKFLNKLLREMSLKEIMDTEAIIVKETQTLHSDMQTLVYENYNKFISATDTIRKMKTDFKQMETEMKLLKENMNSITTFSENITGTLQDTRGQLCKLSGKYSLLNRLQFLSTLPAKLKSLIEEKNYVQAVQDYGHAQKVLQHYGSHPSFQGIQADCLQMVEEMKLNLRREFQVTGQTAQSLTESGELLLHLGERPSELSKEMLVNANQRLHEQIVMLQDQTDGDMIEFIDLGIEGFLNDLNLVVSSYTDMFLKREFVDIEADDYQDVARADLATFIGKNMEKYLSLIEERVAAETGRSDSHVMLRALDRLHRRLLAMKTLCNSVDMIRTGTDIVLNAANQLCKSHLKTLKDHFTDRLQSIRLQLVTIRNDNSTNTSAPNLNESISSLYLASIEKARGVLQDLLIFLLPEWSFNLKSNYKEILCVDGIREHLLVSYFRFITQTAESFCDVNSTSPPNLLLLLAKICVEMDQAGVHTLMSLADELFEIESELSAELTHETELCAEMRATAQHLLDTFVRMQGLTLSQMLRKSVETRDWLNCLEPRSVRAVMKRVVEELNSIEIVLDELFENVAVGTAGADFTTSVTRASSDSSRKTYYSVTNASAKNQFRSNWSNYTPSLDSTFVSNMHRLFSERIEIFSSVEFNKSSILTGIIKICLKTLLECVRMKTLSKFGLQQIQVDAHYLQMNLWRFVNDENLPAVLLDEILGSAVHRCLDPILMEPNAVEIICERS